MAITKPPVKNVWAETAANPADIVEPSSGEVSTGWVQSSTPPSRQRFNWILNFVSNAVRYFSRAGIADYDAAETYVIGDLTRSDDGLIRRSRVNANINHTPSTSPTQWGSPLVPTAAADDATPNIASTGYVIGQISVTLPSMNGSAAIGVSFKFARADHVHPSDSSKANTSGNYPLLTVGAATNASNVPWAGVSGRPTTVAGYGIGDAITTGNIGAQAVAFANNANRAHPVRGDNVAFDINWAGQAGQPNWLVGGNDGVNFYVYNPANFSVNFATNAGRAYPNRSDGTPINVIWADPGGSPGYLLGSDDGVNFRAYPPLRARSYGFTGFRMDADGFIDQWGRVTYGNLIGGFGNNAVFVTFPLAFPNNCLNLTFGKSGSGSAAVPDATTLSNSGFTLVNEEMAGVNQGTHEIHWRAIGN